MEVKHSFSNPNGGPRYLLGLFYETSRDKGTVLYSLKEHDHEGFPSLYLLYMSSEDPTEYHFATTYLDGWSHWEELCACTWFQPYLSAWRLEREVKLRAASLSRILSVAADQSNTNSYYANKYLLDGSWKPAGALKRGRPSKDEVQAEIKRVAASQSQIKEDAERLGLN